MKPIKLRPRQVENIKLGLSECELLENEFKIAKERNQEIPDELIKAVDFCRNRLEHYKRHYIDNGSSSDMEDGERKFINV